MRQFADNSSLLRVRGLVKHFPARRTLFARAKAPIRAVEGVDLDLRSGETLGLVGESGCGKSTTARCILRLVEATAGTIQVQGHDVRGLKGETLRRFRRHMQIIFQDPYGSLNPRLTVGQALEEPLLVHEAADAATRRGRVVEMLERVGLSAEHLGRYPHEFSGGQRQRLGIARALILGPELVIADEPVSALDLSVQAQILNLLRDLQKELNLGYLFIAHDLAVVQHMSHRIAVMYAGRIVEEGPARNVVANPKHPYTRALLAAAPRLRPQAGASDAALTGDTPPARQRPVGCPFHPRCPEIRDECVLSRPELLDTGGAHRVACWIHAPETSGRESQ